MSKDDCGLPRTIEVDILQSDIEQGKSCDTENCVLATALKRMGHKEIEVMEDRTYIGKRVFAHNPVIKEYIRAFDQRNMISLAKFVLGTRIDEVVAEAKKRGRPKGSKNVRPSVSDENPVEVSGGERSVVEPS